MSHGAAVPPLLSQLTVLSFVAVYLLHWEYYYLLTNPTPHAPY
jgi:hypothetical protein